MIRLVMIALVTVSSLLAACGSEVVDGENYGNLLASPSGLVLTQAEHEEGWGRGDCTLCHNLNNIHIEDLTGTGIDMAAIREQTFADGLSGCAGCHGSNQ